MNDVITVELQSVLDRPRPCRCPEPHVVVDRDGRCMSCGFEPYSHEPRAA